MQMINIIEKKRDHQILREEEIFFFINGYVKNEIPDYQMSALLMAIFLNGMNSQETFYLTKAMLLSGDVFDRKGINGVILDKHSTGGVGDKVTLILAPLLASFGLKVAKMSGRGLGHTGGTLDKLEAIKGFDINLNLGDFKKQVNDIGISVIGQTTKITPADKLLYALRDVSGTVDSIPLIASSIMAKKLVIKPDILLLDIKVGKGAFMQTKARGLKLAHLMVDIGKQFGVKTICFLTNMDEPLGMAVGNNLEVIEAINTLKGNGPKDLTKLIYALATEALIESKLCYSTLEANKMINDKINRFDAFNKLIEMVQYQKGDCEYLANVDLFEKPAKIIDVIANQNGYISTIDAKKIGILAMQLGAGRQVKTDTIDPRVGIIVKKKCMDYVNKGDVIASIYSNGKDIYNDVLNAFSIGLKNKRKPLIIQIVKE